MAQFAPETAVRWLSELSFMSESSASDTALVSPIASPGSRLPPGPGSAVAVPRNVARRSFIAASSGGGSPMIVALSAK